MQRVLGLVETGADGRSLSVNIVDFDCPGCLDDIADLGLTLAEGKQLAVLDDATKRPLHAGTAQRGGMTPALKPPSMTNSVPVM